MSSFLDLSHCITDGMVTYPGLPTPVVADHLTREAAEEIYGPGITFQIGLVTMCTNTGTYMDVPFHRFADGHDLTEVPLERVCDLPAICLDKRGQTAIDLTPEEVAGTADGAVLILTGHSQHWGTDAYMEDHPYLTAAAADVLVEAGVAVVGIDTLNIDSIDGTGRPVHTTLLRQEIYIIEHMTGLEQLPTDGFTLTAVPPKIEGAGTFTVRAFVKLD